MVRGYIPGDEGDWRDGRETWAKGKANDPVCEECGADLPAHDAYYCGECGHLNSQKEGIATPRHAYDD